MSSDPEKQASQLLQCLTQDKKPLGLLLAGCAHQGARPFGSPGQGPRPHPGAWQSDHPEFRAFMSASNPPNATKGPQSNGRQEGSGRESHKPDRPDEALCSSGKLP